MYFSAGLSKGLNKPFKPPLSSNNSSPPTSNTPSLVKPNPLAQPRPEIKTLAKPLQLKPLIPKKNEPEVVQAQETNEDGNDRWYFSVFYTKDVKKKKRNYSEGILEITRQKVNLFDNDGNKTYDTPRGRFFKEEPKPEEEYFLGSYLVEIQKKVPQEEFNSGRCFLSKSVKIDNKPQIVTSSLVHKKMKITPKSGELVVDIEIPEGSYMLTDPEDKSIVPCFIDAFLANQMRPHQKEGVKFMFDCLVGFRGPDINGCILAVTNYLKLITSQDSMGLGKTLQTIGVIWTLLKKNPYSNYKPFINKVIVVTPLSMVKAWEKEILKWLGRARLSPLVAMGSREEIIPNIERFVQGFYRCLLISYENFRAYATKLNGHCDLLVFDEGHRLKNNNLKTFQILANFNCKKRIILTGTPLQNCLEELYACCDFINPGIFSSLNTFKKVFVNPILSGLKKNATPVDQEIARERSKELSKIISSFILRRPASILENILPPKHEYFIFLSLTEVQRAAYKKVLYQKIYKPDTTEELGEAFSIILVMRKLLNSPNLLFEDKSDTASIAIGAFNGQVTGEEIWNFSNKLLFTKQLIEHMEPSDKLIIVSYFTQTLDLIERICDATNSKFLRLDGQVAAVKRQNLIDRFNDKSSDIKIFLLCAKAGGTGLNLTGANKMILFEADWNPSNDHQVMGRIWRDGQKKEAQIYRLISCGTIEERIIQRQFIKENLSMNVVDEKNIKNLFDTNDIKKIFKFENDHDCITFKEEENEKDIIFDSQLLPDCMKDYIPFIKRKTDLTAKENEGEEAKSKSVTPAKNQFEEENIFLLPEEVKKKRKKNEDDGEKSAEEDNDEEAAAEEEYVGSNDIDGENYYGEDDSKSINSSKMQLEEDNDKDEEDEDQSSSKDLEEETKQKSDEQEAKIKINGCKLYEEPKCAEADENVIEEETVKSNDRRQEQPTGKSIGQNVLKKLKLI